MPDRQNPKNAQPKAHKKQKEPKQKRLANNKTIFKRFMPKNKYLEDIRIGEIDISFLILVLILLVFGMIMMYSASYAWAIHDNNPQDYYFKRQLFMAAIGLVAMAFLSSRFFDYHILRSTAISNTIFVICIVFMILVHTDLFGVTDSGASRWVKIAIGSKTLFTFQPSELMKLAVIIIFSARISAGHQRLKEKGGLWQYVIILLIAAGFTVIQPHLSGTIIICAIAFTLLYVGGANIKSLITLALAGIVGLTLVAFILYKFADFSYIMNRIECWLHTFDEANRDIAWQTRNSLIAIGSGGVFGLGLGNSRQKFLYLPESQNDFVFAIVCEELGFVGAAVVIILFLMLIFRGFKIAENAPDKFGMLLVTGLITQIGIQALLNIAVVSNAIPNTGISLPFFSYGGTALIIQLCEMGLILNVSRQSMPDKEQPDAAPTQQSREIEQAKKQLGENARSRQK